MSVGLPGLLVGGNRVILRSLVLTHYYRVTDRKYKVHSTESTKILVHAFVTSRIDYCNSLLANAPSVWTDKLQRVLNAAAHVITDTQKFDRGLTTILRDDLQWLDLPRRVSYKL